MTRFSAVVLLAVWPCVLFAQTRQPQEFQVSLASTPIVVDGRLEEPATSHRLFSQYLFSYKPNPQTVLLVGYSDNATGTQAIDLMRTDRTFFVKAGYAWVR